MSVDAEGLVVNKDGSYWVSDEYGPYVYHFSAWGQLLNTVTLPKALLPYKDGKLNFTSETQPDTGRSGNQGFEVRPRPPFLFLIWLSVDILGSSSFLLLSGSDHQLEEHYALGAPPKRYRPGRWSRRQCVSFSLLLFSQSPRLILLSITSLFSAEARCKPF